MELIEKNPFRILGLSITANARVIQKQINTVETYSEMGKAMSFDTDYPFLAPVERTTAVIDEAKRRIQLDEHKFQHSLFWFWPNNSTDDLALELLSDGKVDKATEIWEKAVFAKCERVFRPVPFISDLIQEVDTWSEKDDDDHRLEMDRGEYTIERKVETSSSIPVVFADFGDEGDDWIIECEAEWMGGTDNAGFGIVFGRDNDSYFKFEISGNGYFRFGKTVNWNYVELIQWTELDAIEEIDPNHLQIKKIDNEFSFYVNGVLADKADYEPLFGKNFGFSVCNNQTIVFRKFSLSKIEEDDRYGRGVVVTSKNFSCVKNLSTLFMSQTAQNGILKSHIFDKAIALANKFFSFEQIEEYSKQVIGEKFICDQKKIAESYLSAIAGALRPTLDKTYGVTTYGFLKAISEFPGEAVINVRRSFIDRQIQNINRAVEQSETSRKVDQRTALELGKELIAKSSSDIKHLSEVLDDSDFEYQVVADRLAKELIQCGIAYFNETGDDEPCLPLYQYGLSIAATQRTKEFARENLESCEKWITASKPTTSIFKAVDRIRRERELSPRNAINSGKSLVESTRTDLDQLRVALGQNDPEYKKMADLLAREAIQCAIQFFNTTKNDEDGLSLYQFGYATAGTADTKKWAKENLESCIEWIKTKVYRLCFFCSKNEPKIISSVDITMYLETDRSYFPRRVEFSYGDVSVPRCEECARIHEQLSSYLFKFFGIIIAALVVGFVVGVALAPKNSEIGVGLVSAIIPGIIGWMIAKRFITPVDSKGIRKINAASEYPIIQERLKQGWTFSKPSA